MAWVTVLSILVQNLIPRNANDSPTHIKRLWSGGLFKYSASREPHNTRRRATFHIRWTTSMVVNSLRLESSPLVSDFWALTPAFSLRGFQTPDPRFPYHRTGGFFGPEYSVKSKKASGTPRRISSTLSAERRYTWCGIFRQSIHASSIYLIISMCCTISSKDIFGPPVIIFFNF